MLKKILTARFKLTDKKSVMNRYFFLLVFLFVPVGKIWSAEIDSPLKICDCPEIENLTQDVYRVLSLAGKDMGMSQEDLMTIDQVQLLLSIQRDATGGQVCREHTNLFLNETQSNHSRLSLLSSGLFEFGIKTYGVDLSTFAPSLIHLSGKGSRELFFKGRLNEEEVYFHLIIQANGKSSLSYLPVEVPERKPSYTVSSTATMDEYGEEIINYNYQVSEAESGLPIIGIEGSQSLMTTLFYIHNEDGSESFRFRTNVIQPEDGESATAGPIDLQYKFTNEGTKFKFKTEVDPNEQTVTKVKAGVTQEVIPAVEVNANAETLGSHSVKTESGFKLGEDDFNFRFTTTTLNAVPAKHEASLFGRYEDYTGKVSVSTQERGETYSLENGLMVTDSTEIHNNFILDPSYQQVGVGASYTEVNEGGNFRIGCDVNVKLIQDDLYSLTPQLDYQNTAGSEDAHVISCETAPVIDNKGFVGVNLKAQYDYRIDENATVGVFVQGVSYDSSRRPSSEMSGIIGLQGKVLLGGDRDIRKLKKFTLKQARIEERAGLQQQIGYYETTIYECDPQKQSVKVISPSKSFFGGFFGGSELKDLYQVAISRESKLAQVFYQPEDMTPDSFCKFSN